MEQFHKLDIEETARALMSAFSEDPLFLLVMPDKKMREFFMYGIFKGAIMATNIPTTRILKDDTTGEICAAAVYDNERDKCCFELMKFCNVTMLFKCGIWSIGWLAEQQYGRRCNSMCDCNWWKAYFTNICFLMRYQFHMMYVIVMLLPFFKDMELADKKAKESFGLAKGGANYDKERKIKKKHLNVFGVKSTFQGKGKGSVLLKESLAEIDNDDYYDYFHLESSNPKNVPFYQRCGFEIMGCAIIGRKKGATDGGCVITFMARSTRYGNATPDNVNRNNSIILEMPGEPEIEHRASWTDKK